jgi:hypothetical protein
VRGIELDPAIAETARRRLREAGFSGSVEAGDIFATPLDADVIYAYLTPAMLGQLRPQFAQARPGTRLVTPRYEVVGWEPLAARDGNFLYELPAVRRPAPRVPGWPMRALIVTLRAGRSALLPLTFNAVCGPLELQVEASLADGAKYATTEAPQEEPAPVAMDLVFEPRPAGAVMGGLIRAQGADLTVAAVFTNAQPQKWTFRAGEGVRFQDTLDHVVAEARRGANTTSSASHSG